MSDMRYLKRRGHTYYSRVRVPRELAPDVGSSEIVRSLQTRDLTEAQRRRWQHVQEAQELFARTRRGDDSLTPEEIQAEAWEVYHDTLRDAEERGMDEHATDEALDLTHGVLADHHGTMSDLEEARAWAAVEALRGRLDALRGRPVIPPLSFGRRTAVDRTTLQPIRPAKRRPMATVSSTSGHALAFSDAARRYLEELQRDPDANVTKQTIGQSEAVFRLFVDFSKDAALTNINRALAADFLDTVSTLSPTWGRSPKTKSLTLDQLLKNHAGGEEGLSNKTLNRYAMSCGAVYKWAKRRGLYEGDNPFEGQTRKKSQSRKTGWVPFDDTELTTLLSSLSPVVAPNQHTIDTALSWVTWVAAFSGMRLNEVCSLTVDDIRQEDGVWYFQIDEAKTAAGDRRVPVHSKLIEKGLLDYRQRVGSGPMWPALKPGGPDGKLSWYLSKRFTTRRRELGLTRARLSFHGLRKNVATALERARVPESEAVQVMGHDAMSMSYSVYSLGLDLKGLRDVVEKLQYPHVD